MLNIILSIALVGIVTCLLALLVGVVIMVWREILE